MEKEQPIEEFKPRKKGFMATLDNYAGSLMLVGYGAFFGTGFGLTVNPNVDYGSNVEVNSYGVMINDTISQLKNPNRKTLVKEFDGNLPTRLEIRKQYNDLIGDLEKKFGVQIRDHDNIKMAEEMDYNHDNAITLDEITAYQSGEKPVEKKNCFN